MYILGINAFHGDASATLIKDGELICAVEEERFNRAKHSADFPALAIQACLDEAGIGIDGVEHIAVSKDPKANLMDKVLYTLKKGFSIASIVADRLKHAGKVVDVRAIIANKLGVSKADVRAKVHNIEHHLAHMASAFYVSPFDRAAILSVDGFGDFISTKLGAGNDTSIEILGQVEYPHSLGIFYTAITQFIGFPKYGDEGKAMGLAPYGEPRFLDEMRNIVRLKKNGLFALDLGYFIHHTEGVDMSWEGGSPTLGRVFSNKLIDAFGPPREPKTEYIQHYKDVISSAQHMYEEALMHLANHLHAKVGGKRLCLAGGVALNSCGNGKISDHTPFEEFYIQPAAGDNGTSLGAAYYVYNKVLGRPRNFVMISAATGPRYSDEEVDAVVAEWKAGTLSRDRVAKGEQHEVSAPQGDEFSFERLDDEALYKRTAKAVADGKIVGWFQDRMEFGPRALGNRSIVADPRRGDMKDILNSRIKHREHFRPFAPSLLEEAVGEYFEKSHPSPHMLMVYRIREDKREVIPAVCHVDHTGRLQSVSEADNPRYYQLIKAFGEETGVPVVLNTSFNENEPIVCSPADAINCFAKTKMDVLVLGNLFVERK